MIEKKLASFLALIGFITLAATWLVRKMNGSPTVEIDQLCTYALFVIGGLFIYGLLIAKVGIALIQEVVEEQRGQEEEKRMRAKERYARSKEGGAEAEGEAEGEVVATIGGVEPAEGTEA